MASTEYVPRPIIEQQANHDSADFKHPFLVTAGTLALIFSGVGYAVESGFADSTLNAVLPQPPVHEMVTPQGSQDIKPGQKYIVLKQKTTDAPMFSRPFSTSVKELTAAAHWLRHHV